MSDIAEKDAEIERAKRLWIHDETGAVVTQGAFNALVCQDKRRAAELASLRALCGDKETEINIATTIIREWESGEKSQIEALQALHIRLVLVPIQREFDAASKGGA